MSDRNRHDDRNSGQLQDERSELSRRRFLEYGAAGGALLFAGPAACGPAEDSPVGSPTDSTAGRGERAHPDVEPFELDEITIDELREGMRSGRWTARSLTEQYLERIEALNRNGPELRAVIETNPDALEIADRLDQIRRDDDEVGPLHGIPILLKDNIGTHDRMTTTAGSYALEGSVPATDSAVASRLRQAGAVLLGKANLSGGRISAPPDPAAAGAPAGASAGTRTSWIATPVDRVPARRPRSPRT